MAHYDVIIIGTCAGGGTLARHLAPSDKKILLIERGGWLPREPQNVSAEEVFVNGRYSPSATTTSMGPAARTRPSHPRARRTRSRRCRMSRASRSSQTTSRSSDTIPSTPPAA
jgi:choline dehydrogenase-like flavoprotein